MWVILAMAFLGLLLLVLFVLLVFVLLTEGRYFGKRLLRWLYGRRSVEFEVRDDWNLWQHFIQRIDVSLQERLLDLGTQTGHLPRLVARRRGFSGLAIGIDWVEGMVKEARRQARLEGTANRTKFFCQDLRHPLPFEENTFTLVTCVTGALEALRNPTSLFNEIQRVLQPNGRAVFAYSSRQLKTTSGAGTKWFKSQLEKLSFSDFQLIPWTSTRKLLVSTLRPQEETS